MDRLEADAALVRGTLEGVGYSADAVGALLGAADARLSPSEQALVWRHRARGSDRLATVTRLLLLGQAVPLSLARQALGDLGPWRRLGLLRVTARQVVPRLQLAPHLGLLIASDLETSRPRPDHVMGPTTATLMLDRMTFRRPVARALDLGTGSGYLALRLAAHARQVAASDVAARALALARLNAALNERSIELVTSDRFSGLSRRRFDLVVGNLPFVISPERRFVYRDAGLSGDDFLAAVIGEVGRHLVDGGFAQLLGQWVHRRGEDEDERVAPWLVRAGCDAMIVRLETEPVDQYAARWLEGPAPLPMPARARRFARWMAFYEQTGVQAISTGLWILRRRKTGRHFMLFDDASPAHPPTGEDLLDRFAALDG